MRWIHRTDAKGRPGTHTGQVNDLFVPSSSGTMERAKVEKEAASSASISSMISSTLIEPKKEISSSTSISTTLI